MDIIKKELYQNDAKGRLRLWSIEVIDGKFSPILLVKTGLADGKLQEIETPITRGFGNKNAYQQAIFDMETEVSKKLKRGYVFDKENPKSIFDSATIGKPAKGHPYHPTRGQKTDYTLDKAKMRGTKVGVQLKYDGHRYRIQCIIDRDLYDSGKEFSECLTIIYYKSGGDVDKHGFEHMEEEITGLAFSVWHSLDYDICDFILDGEIYNHELGYNAVASACGTTKHFTPEKQALRDKMNFYWFDICGDKRIESLSYSERYNCIKHIINAYLSKNIYLSWVVLSDLNEIIAQDETIHELFENALKAKYEGLIIRDMSATYKHSKTAQFLKFKPVMDDEFYIIGFNESIQGETLGSFICVTAKAKQFSCDLKGEIGTDKNKQYIWENRQEFLNRVVTVEFLEYTPDGLPRNPKAIKFRKGIGAD